MKRDKCHLSTISFSGYQSTFVYFCLTFFPLLFPIEFCLAWLYHQRVYLWRAAGM
jgi:hypothetical protein